MQKLPKDEFNIHWRSLMWDWQHCRKNCNFKLIYVKPFRSRSSPVICRMFFFLIRYFILNALSNLLLYVNVSCLYTPGVTPNCVCDSTVINKCSGFPSSGVAFLCNALVCALASSSLGENGCRSPNSQLWALLCSVPPCVTVVALLGLVYAKTVCFSNLLKEKNLSFWEVAVIGILRILCWDVGCFSFPLSTLSHSMLCGFLATSKSWSLLVLDLHFWLPAFFMKTLILPSFSEGQMLFFCCSCWSSVLLSPQCPETGQSVTRQLPPPPGRAERSYRWGLWQTRLLCGSHWSVKDFKYNTVYTGLAMRTQLWSLCFCFDFFPN